MSFKDTKLHENPWQILSTNTKYENNWLRVDHHDVINPAGNPGIYTLLPQMALDAGILRGTRLVARPLAGERAWREIGVAWRRGSARRAEYALLAEELRGLIGKRDGASARA